ncbi:hypothetical protein [Oceanirhabdus sp. W0125-5]|uniref:hypothetical protein n=1 Tax=Oceanirhabdus sp. W0125-5 TaxID=2999116 RepID=UPI0022F2F72D|nr:hypothetical protein [Oceanirhabdus sp. W0125-5]WBW98680.1 hypothetical protein OW730_07955 [Oceanirhabdus sp. W0125-5]
MNKKILIPIMVVLLIIGGVVFGIYKSEQGKGTPDNKYVTVKHRDASLGSIVGVDLSEEGKNKYPMAETYRVFTEENFEMSVEATKIGEETIILPKSKPGKTVVIYLFDKEGDLVDKLNSKIIK